MGRVRRQVSSSMLGHPTVAKMMAIATMMEKKMANHAMLVGKHPGTSPGLDTIVEKRSACKFPLAL
jgi:hypothetical protein